MLDRFMPFLKMICLVLAALLVAQMVRLLVHGDPLGRATIPPLPKLTLEPEIKPATNAAPGKKKTEMTVGTNSISVHKDTNSVVKSKAPRRAGGSHFGGPAVALILPPPVQTRIDRIKESEILAPFIRPQPMALLGIADDNAFLRAPDGQTGMIKEGGDLGGIKLLRIGINRVLVEEDGKKKELVLFDGFGGDSLMPKETNNSTNLQNTSDKKENP